MKIQSSARRNQATNSPVFSHNPQDKSVLDPGTTQLETFRPGRNGPASDKVKLRNIHLLMPSQRFSVDAQFRLNPNRDGSYVFEEGTRDYTSANAFTAAAKTVETFDSKMQALTGRSIQWAFDDKQLGIAPHAGDKIDQPFPNAFYYRPAGNLFFFDYDTPAGPTSTGNSGEIVGHEAGHAILDALKPNFMTSFSFEAAAFHEAFGDVVSILMSLEDPRVVDKAVAQSGGDLSNPNLIAELGEEMGPAIGASSVRDARNNFKYVDPDTLPDPERGEHAERGELARESHSFARVWTGAFYELIDRISDDYRARGASPREALQQAGKEGWRLLIGQMDNATDGGFVSFDGLAKNLLEGDAQLNGGRRGDLIREVFGQRNILSPRLGLVDGLEESSQRGELAELSVKLGADFPEELRGVTVRTQHEKSIFASDQDEKAKAAKLTSDVAALVRAGEVYIPAEGEKPDLGDFLRDDGSYYQAYLDRESNELKRVLIAG